MVRVTFNEENKEWRSVDLTDPDVSSTYDSRVSLGFTVLNAMKSHASKVAQISDDTGKRFTFNELQIRTIRVAQNLQRLGCKRNQVIGIVAGDEADLAPIVFASFCLACPIKPMPKTADKLNIVHTFRETVPNLVFCKNSLYDLVVECLRELGNDAKIFTFNGTRNGSISVESLLEATGTEEDFTPIEIDATKEIAAVMSSSGTTGQSKGICTSHAVLMSQIEPMRQAFENKVCFSQSSIFWFSGLRSLLLATIHGATRIINSDPLTSECLWRLVEKYRVNIFYCGSYHLLEWFESGILLKVDLSSVEHAVLCGCNVSFSIRNQLTAYLPNGKVHNEYGLTELGPVAIDYPNPNEKGAAGELLNGFTVKIVDDNENRCGIGIIGEICIKNRYRFLGYYNNNELTKNAIDDEGFFRTGDLGYMDNDGNLYVADRKKDTIVYDEWVFPSEVETVLLRSPDVKAVCVVGIPYNQIIEWPTAVVVRSKGSTISKGDVCRIVEDNLSDSCKLRGGVYFVDSIPTTASGKPLRRLVKETATKLYKAEHTSV